MFLAAGQPVISVDTRKRNTWAGTPTAAPMPTQGPAPEKTNTYKLSVGKLGEAVH